MKTYRCKQCGIKKELETAIIYGISKFCSLSCKKKYFSDLKKKKLEKEKIKRKNKRESISMLTHKLDGIFSEYIRKKYSDQKGNISCISCNKVIHWTEAHNCHWLGRGNKQFRFDEDNCRPGCAGCNTFNQEFHQRIFTIKQIERLGIEKVNSMIEQSKLIYKLGKNDLKELIEEYTIKLNNLNK